MQTEDLKPPSVPDEGGRGAQETLSIRYWDQSPVAPSIRKPQSQRAPESSGSRKWRRASPWRSPRFTQAETSKLNSVRSVNAWNSERLDPSERTEARSKVIARTNRQVLQSFIALLFIVYLFSFYLLQIRCSKLPKETETIHVMPHLTTRGRH